MIQMVKWILLTVAVVVLTACGGGGGSSEDSSISSTNTSTSTNTPTNTPPTATSTSLKKTGQTKSYDVNGNEVTDSSLKDDGYYQKGVAPNYTRDDTTQIVTDHITGLMWQDDVAVATVIKPWLTQANYNACVADTTFSACTDTSGDTAATYCSDLTLGGYTDWRLPTPKELEGIVDYRKVTPAIDRTYFHNVSPNYYWSSTTYEGYRNGAWIVYFDYGYVGYYSKTNSLHVRCVRSGQ